MMILRLLGSAEWRMRAVLRLQRGPASRAALTAAMGDYSTRPERDISDMRRDGWIEKVTAGGEQVYRLTPLLAAMAPHLAAALLAGNAAPRRESADDHRTRQLRTGRHGTVLGLLGRRGMTCEQMEQKTGLSLSNVRNIMCRLHRAGAVEQCGGMRWRAVAEGGRCRPKKSNGQSRDTNTTRTARIGFGRRRRTTCGAAICGVRPSRMP